MAEKSDKLKIDYGYRSRERGGFRGFTAQFQRHALAILATHTDVFRRYRTVVNPDYFESELDQQICRAVLTVYDETRQLPSRATLIQLVTESVPDDKKPELTKRVRNLYSAKIDDADYVVSRLVEFAKFRAMANAIVKAGHDLVRGKTESMFPLVQNAMQVGADRTDIGSDFRATQKRRIKLRKRGKLNPPTIPTGLPHLDYIMRGGSRRGEVIVTIGVQKVGKSTVLINFAFGACSAGYGVLYVTFVDLSKEEVMDRLDHRIVGVKHAHLSQQDPDEFCRLLEKRTPILINAPFVVHKMKLGATCNDVYNHIELLRAEGIRIDRLVLDHADHMRPNPDARIRYDDPVQRAAEVFVQLKELAERANVDIYTATQANASADDRESMGRGSVSWSRDKLSHCTMALAINQTPDERDNNRARLGIVVTRRTRDDAQVECVFNKDRYYLQSIALVSSDRKRVIPTPFDKDTKHSFTTRKNADQLRKENKPETASPDAE